MKRRDFLKLSAGLGAGLGPPFSDGAALPAAIIVALAARSLGKRGPLIFAVGVHKPRRHNKDSRSVLTC